MNITFLGSSAAYPGPGEACSGFLVQQDQTNLLVDCGTGVLSNLQRFLDLRHVTDIVISHMHADHFFDLIPYRYALRYGFVASQNPKPALHLPPGGIDVLRQVTAPFAESPAFFEEAFKVSEYSTERPLHLSKLDLRFVPVRHYIPCYAMSIVGDKRVSYTADSGPCHQLTDVAGNADLLICNIGKAGQEMNPSLWGHMGPDEAGALARHARVGRLMISHMWPGYEHRLGLSEARRAFGGTVELAEPGRPFAV